MITISHERNELDGLKRLLADKPLMNWSDEKYPIGDDNEVVKMNGAEVLRRLLCGQLFLVSRNAIERLIKKLEETPCE